MGIVCMVSLFFYQGFGSLLENKTDDDKRSCIIRYGCVGATPNDVRGA